MKPYLRALYDPTPSRLIENRDRHEEDPFELFELASAGLFDLLFTARRRGPQPDDSPVELAEISPLASALVDYVTGRGPTPGLADVRGEDGESTAAAIITSVQLTDAGQASAACDGLRAFLEQLDDDLVADQIAILVHLGLRTAEAGAWVEAIEHTENAIAMSEAAGFEGSSVLGERLLHYVAKQNLFTFDQYGRGRVIFSPGGPRRSFPDLVMTNVGDGLDAWMEADFNSAFADPDQRSISFSSSDRSERSFLAAVVRAELVGSWHWRRVARRALGRFSLRRFLGKPRGDVATGIATLVEAEDSKGLTLTARHFRRYGPLAGLAEVAAGLVAERPWGPTRVASSVAVLRESVDLLTEQAATELTERLATDFELLRRPTRMTDLTVDVLSLVARIARQWRSAAIQTTVSKALLTWLAASEDALLQQRSVSIVRAVDWTAVPLETIDAWRNHALAHLDGDMGFPSRAFLEAAVVTGEPAEEALHEAYEQTGDASMGFILFQLGRLDEDRSARLVSDAASWVSNRAAEAGRGMFAMYADDQALVLAVGASRGLEEAWPPLIEFLRNPAVPLSFKEGSLQYLRDHIADMPDSWRDDIAAAGDDLAIGSDVLISAPSTAVEAAGLRLAAGGLSADEIRSEVIRAATSGDDSERTAAVQLLVDARETVGLEATTMTLLLLTRDRHPQVRAEAGRCLSQVANERDPDLGVRARILEMLREPGTAVPSAVLFGILKEKVRFAELLLPCVALAEEHLSVEVRTMARAVVDMHNTPG